MVHFVYDKFVRKLLKLSFPAVLMFVNASGHAINMKQN